MNPKSLAILGAITVVVLAAALFSARGGDAAEKDEAGPLFTELKAQATEVSRVEVEKADQRTTLVRDGQDWTCEEVNGYPADVTKVRDLLRTLVSLEILEPKTSRAENHGRLGVDATAGATVTLKDAAGQTLAALVVGNTEYARTAQRVYVRRDGEDQVYLCEGDLTVAGDPMTWVSKEILRVANARPSAVEIEHADGERLSVTKSFPAAPNWDVAGVPPDRGLKNEGVGNGVGTALSYLSFDEVRSAEELALAENRVGKATYRTFDGLRVEVEVAEIDEQHWITLTADYEAPPQPEPVADQEASGQAAESAGQKEAEIQAEVAELGARVAGWAYRIPSYKAEVLLRRMEDLLAEPLPEPEEPVQGPPLEPVDGDPILAPTTDPAEDPPGESVPNTEDVSSQGDTKPNEEAGEGSEPPTEGGGGDTGGGR